jgi:hypothetical protein
MASTELTFKILDTWLKDTPVVLYCHMWQRSLDAAPYSAGHGFVASSLVRGFVGLIALAAIALPAFISIGDPSGASGGSVGRTVTVPPAAEARSEEQEVTPIELAPTTETLVEIHRNWTSANTGLFLRYHFCACENRSDKPTETQMLVEVHRNWMRE